MSAPDAVVIGSGPNGLAAAVTLAQAGLSVLVREAEDVAGGGTRTSELTVPGFAHDVCSAVHPLAAGSPFLRTLPLEDHGLRFVQPAAPLAHPLDGGRAVMLERSLDATAANLGADGPAYRRIVGRTVRDWRHLERSLLGPLLRVPRHLPSLAGFGLHAVRSASGLSSGAFKEPATRALFAGAAAHSILPLENPATASFGMVLLALAHEHGWPFVEGGSQGLANALVGHLRSLGGEVQTAAPVESLDELSGVGIVLCDVGPREFARLAGSRLPQRYLRSLARFRYGPGVFKLDYALDGPVPWEAPECARAGTVHLGGTLAEIARSERAPWRGGHAQEPFVLVAQPSAFDHTRAPAGKHTLWAYCHVPNGSSTDMTNAIEAQIERFAPGFRDRVLARSIMGPDRLQQHNRNLVGGDVNGGAGNLRQLVARPVFRLRPYSTPIEGVYLCSASTPPGGGVHGMGGYHAARAALRKHRPG
jgi:phytoene dehydrogenase-like protein